MDHYEEMARSKMDEQKKKLLRLRALELASEPVRRDTIEEGEKYLEFCIGKEHYAIEAAHVKEVYPLKRITPLPCAPSFVLGIINLRGQIFSVMDIRETLGIQAESVPEAAKVVVIFSQDLEVAILVDEVMGIRNFSLNDITDDLSLTKTQGIDFVSGVTRDRTSLLDAGKLLLAERIIVNEEVK